MEDLISVIIPVYNVENYIRYCLDSVIKQTYKNLEIIIVDDGTKDSSGKIADEYASKDSRIKVIHKENEGVSKARNVALDIAKGKYIAFLDSDDVISLNFYQYLYNLIKQDDYDIAECEFLRILSSEISSVEKILENENKDKNVKIKIETSQNTLYDFYGRYEKPYINKVVVWNKLYKRKIFDNIRYPEGQLFEDEAIMFKILSKINKMISSSKKMYGYIQSNNSAMRKETVNQKQIEDNLRAYESAVNFFKDDVFIQSKCMRRYLENCLELYMKIERGNDDNLKQSKYEFIYKAFKEKYKEYIDIINENIEENEKCILELLKKTYNDFEKNSNPIFTPYYKELQEMQKID